MRFRIQSMVMCVGLWSSTASIAADVEQAHFAATVGMSLGQPPQAAAWLVPLSGVQPRCLRESHYHVDDDTRRFSLAGVRLAPPGLVYKFFDDRLYAVEGRLAAREHAFARLKDALTRQYGPPDVLQGWAGSPSDSFVFQKRLSTAGWFDARTQQSLWLTGHDDGGFLIVTESLTQQPSGNGVAGMCPDGPVGIAVTTGN